MSGCVCVCVFCFLERKRRYFEMFPVAGKSSGERLCYIWVSSAYNMMGVGKIAQGKFVE